MQRLNSLALQLMQLSIKSSFYVDFLMNHVWSPGVEHVLALEVPVYGQGGHLHRCKHLPPALPHYPGGQQRAAVLQLLQGALHQT